MSVPWTSTPPPPARGAFWPFVTPGFEVDTPAPPQCSFLQAVILSQITLNPLSLKSM